MSDLRKPSEDWMVSYIDDLLLDETDTSVDAEDSDKPVEQKPDVSPEAERQVAPKEAGKAPSESPSAETTTGTQVSDFMERHSQPAAKLSVSPAPEFELKSAADEEQVRRDKLQKLLHDSTMRTAVKPTVVENTVKTPPKVELAEAKPVPQPELKVKAEAPVVEPKPAPVVTKVEAPVVEKTEAQAVAEIKQKLLNEAAQQSQSDLATPTETEHAVQAAASHEWQNGRPPWAQERFDVLLFSVSKLTLAVPLVSLGQIQKLSEELTPLFGQADWFMGLLPTPAGKIRCVDTALFVMPDRYQPEFREQYRFVITIDGLPWGLAVDEVKQPIQLDPNEVNWRGVRSQRPWLAGTIKEHMCALLDVPELGRILAEQDKNRRKPDS